MFTGIIEEVGVVSRISGSNLTIMANVVTEDAKLGDSISINGACMTVADLLDDGFAVQVSPESFKRTSLGRLKAGDGVNLERAMSPTSRFGGHMVLGHVDGVGLVVNVTEQGEFSYWEFSAPPEVSKYLVPKGSVAVEGISLTVVEPVGDRFGAAIVPKTRANTTLQARRPGDPVNLEADIMGKHIYHYLKGESSAPLIKDKPLTEAKLAQHGFA